MRNRSLVILAVLALGLGAFIFFVERHGMTTDERAERADRVFPGLDEDEIRSVELRSSRGPVRLVKEGDDWRMVEPMDYPAETAAVLTLIESLERLDSERSLAVAEVDLADYGLDEPNLGVRLEASDGRVFELAVGNEMPLGGMRAVQRAGDDSILMCSGVFVNGLDRGVDDWRSREVVDVLEQNLKAIDVETAEDRIRALRLKDRWQLVEPLADLADAEQMRSLISELNALRVTEFVAADADPAELGLAEPEYRIVLERADDQAPVTLELAHPADDADDVVVRRDGTDLFLVDGGIRARLGKAPVLWRSDKAWPFSSWDAVKVELVSGDQRVVLDQVEDDEGMKVWRFADGGQVDEPELRRRLNALADLEVRDHDLLLPPTEVLGSVIVVLDDDSGAEGLTWTFYAPIEEGGHAVATVSPRADVMGVDDAVVDTILSDLDALRLEPEVLPEDGEASDPE